MQKVDHESNGQCTCTFVSIAMHKENLIPILAKIVKISQKTTGALLKCSEKNCKKFPVRVIYNSQLRSIPAHNWKATWHHYSKVSYADIVKGTIHQAYGKNSVNCPLKVNCQLKAKKVQNINTKVSNLNAHADNTNFNIVKRVTCVKESGVQCKNVGKPRKNVNKLASNCAAKGKNLNIGSCNVSNVNYNSSSKLQHKVSLSCQNSSQLQTNGIFEDVNRFACLHQVSDDNTWSVLSDSSTVSKNNVKNNGEICTHDVVPQSSNTCVSNSNCNVTNVKVNNNYKN